MDIALGILVAIFSVCLVLSLICQGIVAEDGVDSGNRNFLARMRLVTITLVLIVIFVSIWCGQYDCSAAS